MDNKQSSAKSDETVRRKATLFVLSGPSGVGKDAVLDKLKASDIPLKYIVTMTTRQPREKEVNHKDYNFVTAEEFQELIATNGLLEWANVYGNLYGVPAKDVNEALAAGNDVMVKVDIQGVSNILSRKPDAVTIFLLPSSLEELFNRLKLRKTESSSSLEIRMKTATDEMEAVRNFTYAVLNADGQIDKAVEDIKAIIAAERCRVRP